MKAIYVEYEILPLRSIYHQYFADDGQSDKEIAESFLWGKKPNWRIRKIERKEIEGMITPTVGRIVLFWDEAGNGPMAAIVTCVHSERMINITAFSANGEPRGITSVPLVQPGDDVPLGFRCQWMPYQVKKETGSESGEKEAGTQSI